MSTRFFITLSAIEKKTIPRILKIKNGTATKTSYAPVMLEIKWNEWCRMDCRMNDAFSDGFFVVNAVVVAVAADLTYILSGGIKLIFWHWIIDRSKNLIDKNPS